MAGDGPRTGMFFVAGTLIAMTAPTIPWPGSPLEGAQWAIRGGPDSLGAGVPRDLHEGIVTSTGQRPPTRGRDGGVLRGVGPSTSRVSGPQNRIPGQGPEPPKGLCAAGKHYKR